MRHRRNFGQGDLFNFHGAFTEKKDAVAKEQSTPGSFIKTVWYRSGPKYAVLSKKNPRRKKNLLPIPADLTNVFSSIGMLPKEKRRRKRNLTIRKPFSGGRSLYGPGLIRKPFQRRVAKMVRSRRSAGLMTDAEIKRLRKSRKKGPASSVFHELYGPNPHMICGANVGGEECTRKPGHKGPHLPQGATMRPKSRLRKEWKPNPMSKKKRSRKKRNSRKGKMPAALKAYLAKKRAAKQNRRKKRNSRQHSRRRRKQNKRRVVYRTRTVVRYRTRKAKRRRKSNPKRKKSSGFLAKLAKAIKGNPQHFSSAEVRKIKRMQKMGFRKRLKVA